MIIKAKSYKKINEENPQLAYQLHTKGFLFDHWLRVKEVVETPYGYKLYKVRYVRSSETFAIEFIFLKAVFQMLSLSVILNRRNWLERGNIVMSNIENSLRAKNYDF